LQSGRISTEGTDGLLYGVTNAGGADGNGVFFSLNVGFAPFITLQSTSGKVGAKVGILGQGFSSSSMVKFNGVSATTVTFWDHLSNGDCADGSVQRICNRDDRHHHADQHAEIHGA
jgi:hypothetical protein